MITFSNKFHGRMNQRTKLLAIVIQHMPGDEMDLLVAKRIPHTYRKALWWKRNDLGLLFHLWFQVLKALLYHIIYHHQWKNLSLEMNGGSIRTTISSTRQNWLMIGFIIIGTGHKAVLCQYELFTDRNTRDHLV